MSTLSFEEFEKRLDVLTTALLVPLRTSKTLDTAALNGFKKLLSDLATELANQDLVPKALVGKLYFVFSAMLAEASHAKNPGPIVAAAWDVEESLTRIFGPRFG